MGRPRKRIVSTEPAKASPNSFVDALKFLSLITKNQGSINETHVILQAGTAIASNSIISCGVKTPESIYACPHNELMIEALSKCGEYHSITQLDNNRLSIKSNKFKAIIPCVDQTLLAPTQPDMPIAVIDDKLKLAFEAMSGLNCDDDQRLELASILLNGQSVIATNGKMIFEYWHGIDLPPNIALPKSIIAPIIKTSKKLTRFGFSISSVTFWFEDDSWIKSQLYAGEWPKSAGTILDRPTNPFPLPAGFWEAVQAVLPFSPSGMLHFENGLIRSHDNDAIGASFNDAIGASFEVPGLPAGPIFAAKQLLLIKPYAETIDFLADCGRMLMFYGRNIRGGIMGFR